jgi:hypothetical protein
MRLKVALIVLALATLACGQQIVTPTPTVTPTPPPSASPSPVPTATATPRATEAAADTAVIQATVWVRLSDNSDSDRIGSLTTGDRVVIVKCTGQWCEVKAGELSGYVWRGCTDNNPDNLLCEAKP